MYKRDKLKDKKNGEKGFITLMFLAIFVVLTLFFMALYNIAYNDYLKSGEGIINISESTIEGNLVESLASNYKDDMLNDVEYEDQKLLYSYDDKYSKFFNLEYKNYKYEFIKLDEEGNESNKLGSFGRFNWLDFKNYSEDENDGSRIYTISDNWKEDKNLKSDYYSEGKLLLRVPIYIKIDFGSGVNSVNLSIGNDFESQDYNFINRENGSNIYKIESIPYSSDTITLRSDEDLSSTKISLLRKRALDVEVYTIDRFDVKKVKKLTKTINIELGKNQNYIYFD